MLHGQGMVMTQLEAYASADSITVVGALNTYVSLMQCLHVHESCHFSVETVSLHLLHQSIQTGGYCHTTMPEAFAT